MAYFRFGSFRSASHWHQTELRHNNLKVLEVGWRSKPISLCHLHLGTFQYPDGINQKTQQYLQTYILQASGKILSRSWNAWEFWIRRHAVSFFSETGPFFLYGDFNLSTQMFLETFYELKPVNSAPLVWERISLCFTKVIFPAVSLNKLLMYIEVLFALLSNQLNNTYYVPAYMRFGLGILFHLRRCEHNITFPAELRRGSISLHQWLKSDSLVTIQ